MMEGIQKKINFICCSIIMVDLNKIKMDLLKSGLPLELMISKFISDLSPKLPRPLVNNGEYFYERPEAEMPLSIDFVVTYDLDIKECDFVQIVFLIESKYRTRDTKWFFVPNPLNDAGMEFFIENFVSEGRASRKSFPMLAPPLNDNSVPVLGRGIEIYSDGSRNEKSLSEGFHQLMFAAASLLTRAFLNMGLLTGVMRKRGIDITGRSFHSLLCPVLVTTADIRVLKAVDIDSVEQSKNAEDFSDVVKVATYSTPTPPLYVRKYITKDVAKDVESTLPLEAVGRDWLGYLKEYALFFPSRYYVVNFQSITEFIQKYIDYATVMLKLACNLRKES
jgi:hypothetical protein